jgi:hypothetical protein
MEHQQTQESTQAQSAQPEEQRPRRHGEASQVQAAQPDPVSHRVSHCANCDIEFFWPATKVQEHVYCCTGCAAGGPCNCDYSLYRSVTILGVIYYEK